MGKRQKIYNSSQGLVCGDWKCEYEATAMPADLVANLDKVSPENRGNVAASNVKCATHAGAEKRRVYSRTEMVPLTDEVREMALVAVRAKEEWEKANQERERNVEHERQKGLAVHYWKELTNEPDYIVVYEEDQRWSRLERRFSVYTSEVLAHSKESGRPLDDYNSVAQVSVEERKSSFDDVTFPAYLSMRNTSGPTVKLAAAIGEALSQASVLVDAANVRLRKEHDREAKHYNLAPEEVEA